MPLLQSKVGKHPAGSMGLKVILQKGMLCINSDWGGRGLATLASCMGQIQLSFALTDVTLTLVCMYEEEVEGGPSVFKLHPLDDRGCGTTLNWNDMTSGEQALLKSIHIG